MSSLAAIVLAGGTGARMGAPKQFLELAPGERIVDRVLSTCRAMAAWLGVVLPPGAEWRGEAIDAVINGGATRFESVVAGVAAVPAGVDLVVVHSASHPLASVDLLRRAVAAVEAGADGAVPVLPAVDTIKRRNEDGTITTLGREGLGIAQAPMAYRRTVLDDALAEVVTGAGGRSVVEESVAVEAIGGRVVAVEGEPTNLHVTDRASLTIARLLASQTEPPPPPPPPPPPLPT